MRSKHHCCHCDSCDVTFPQRSHRWQLCTSCQVQDHEYPVADGANRTRPNNTRRP